MTDIQLLTIGLGIIIPLSMLIHSNSRISDAKETLRAEIQGETNTLRAEMAALRTEMKAGFDRIEQLLKVHELEHHR